MSFGDIFYLIIIPLLTAVVIGYAVNLYARMRERTRARAYQDRIAVLDRALAELRDEVERMRSVSDARSGMLQLWQEEHLDPLVALREGLGLGTVIALNDKPIGIPAKSAKIFGELQEKISQFRAAGVPILPEIALNLGMLYFNARQWDESVSLFEEAIEGDATNKEARINLGILYLRLRRFEDARVQFQALVELSGSFFEGHLGLGLALIELERLEEAIEALSTAIRLRPEHARSYCELGRAYIAAGEIDRALESAQVALRLDPKMIDGQLLLQKILIKSGNFDEAVAACNKTLRMGDSSRVYYNLAIAQTMKGDYEEALDALRRAFAIDDDIRFTAKDDPALVPLRDSRRFVELIEGRPGLF
ncbi:MAG TPA: tetratricopeptide repeat protein [Acidobacteriota bacterium]|nr:tetratricopeptide repeat protein [Acidobacteriota bacterium]